MIDHYLGFKIVVLPDTVEVRRGWKERFFSLPWRPFTAIQTISNINVPAPGKVFQMGDTLYGVKDTFDTLKKNLEVENKIKNAQICNLFPLHRGTH